MFERVRFSLLLMAVVTPVAVAQRVWIVDAANGPGTNFTDVHTAVTTVPPGDILRVRAGAYGPTLVRDSITILAEPGAVVSGSFTSLQVQGLRAGAQVTIAGLQVGPSVQGELVDGCAGRVVLERVAVPKGLRVSSCADVQLLNCDVTGFGVVCQHSAVVVSGTRVAVTAATAIVSIPAVRLTGGTANIARCVLQGGPGSTLFGPVPAAPAIQAADSSVTLSGDGATVVSAGGNSPSPVPAIVADRGSLVLDPAVTLVPALGAPAIGGSAPVTSTWLPSLIVGGGPISGTATADLFSPAGDLFLFLLGTPSGPIDRGPAGKLWVGAPFLLTGAGVQGSGRHAANDLPVPNDAALTGVLLARQGISGTMAGGFRYTNPALLVLR